jgi:hypothetical protein
VERAERTEEKGRRKESQCRIEELQQGDTDQGAHEEQPLFDTVRGLDNRRDARRLMAVPWPSERSRHGSCCADARSAPVCRDHPSKWNWSAWTGQRSRRHIPSRRPLSIRVPSLASLRDTSVPRLPAICPAVNRSLPVLPGSQPNKAHTNPQPSSTRPGATPSSSSPPAR